MNFLLKTPIYIMDKGPGGAIGLFLAAGLGFVVFIVGKIAEDSYSCLGSMLGQIMIKLGIAMMIGGTISGIISLF